MTFIVVCVDDTKSMVNTCKTNFKFVQTFIYRRYFCCAETSESEVQAVLIDCSSVIFVDVAGARLFTQVRLLKHKMMYMPLSCLHVVNLIHCFWLFTDVY